jgi:hypothetical protein
VVIDNLNLVRFAIFPAEANPVLIVDANAVLALAVASQRFQPVSVGLTKIVQMRSVVQNLQLSPRNPKNPAESAALSRKKDMFGLWVGKRPYHAFIVSRSTHVIQRSPLNQTDTQESQL